MPKFTIMHTTRYTYAGLVRDSANQIILFPINDNYQEVLSHDLKISGDPYVDIYKDYFGNEVGTFTHYLPHTELEIYSKLSVATHHKPLPVDDMFASQQWIDLAAIKSKTPYVDYLLQEHFEGLNELKEVVEQQRIHHETPYQTALRYTKYIFDNYKYIPGITTVETRLDEVWKLKAGVCQDFAHILLVMLRLLNIPSRYVSGYVCPNKNGMRGEGATHAWVETYLPGYGWLGLDPTNNCVANETHVRLAVGRNFPDCTPVKGVYKGQARHNLEVSVSVSYENDVHEENELVEFPVEKPAGFSVNSFQLYTERIEQQQQQQQ
ncbi:transglutaminase family protein [Pedobacter sp. P351]|uniref:transglutaminase family protein n=1 Tax=Pedobacter superstes TaxID=3133441 RepID=UPI0030B2F439